MNGVNVGGWLILEKWLTPSVFEGTPARDEWSLSQTEEGRARIQRHRDTFIKEDDFKWLKDHGITILRLPVPYWAIEPTDEYVPAMKYVSWTMEMAEKYGLQVLIDLHAAPGGQNLGDHSGKQGEMDWFKSKNNQDKTIELLKILAERYKDSPALWGIELLNEPEFRGHYFQLVSFYRRAYSELRTILKPGTRTVFHDAFQPILFAGALWPRKNYPVVMDVHWYGFPLAYTSQFDRYINHSKWLRTMMTRFVQLWQPIIVGEYSSVLPQRFFDARPQAEHTELLERNCTMQQSAYKRTAGSMYWNYKAEGDGMWNFRSLVETGVLSLE
jgi:glucan 1,3-beta-glucosidase